jgi:hypothetical protein
MIQGGMVKRAIGAEDITRAFPPSRPFLQGPYSTRSRGIPSPSFLPFRKRGEWGGMEDEVGAGQRLNPFPLGGSEGGTGRNAGRVMATRAAPESPSARPHVQVDVSFIRGSGAAADETTPVRAGARRPRTFPGTSYGGKWMITVPPGIAHPEALYRLGVAPGVAEQAITAPRVPTGPERIIALITSGGAPHERWGL